jgi:hypothetical protein
MWRYYFTSLILAPGVIVHELGHVFFCILSGVKIHRLVLFRFSRTAGYVVHDEPKSSFQALFIALGPLLINSATTLYLFSLVTKPYQTLANGLYLWLGITIGLQAIPSNGDAKALLTTTNHAIARNPLAIVIYPVTLIIFLLNLLKRLYIDFLFVAFLWWTASLVFIQ